MLLDVRIKLKSPTIIPSKRTREGYVKPLNYLPGSTIRGAVISSLYVEGFLSDDDRKSEAKEPTILSSPAYPTVDGLKSYPPTPFVWKCKHCEEIYDQTRECVEDVVKGREPTFVNECEYCGLPTEPLYGKQLIVRQGKELKEVNVNVFRLTSVGIDKRRYVSAKGMLFDYEAIEEGTEFWCRMRVPDNIEIEGLEIFIGRGVSRGFGHAVIKKVEEYNLRWKDNEILYALSYTLPVKTLFTPYGTTIKVKKIYGRYKRVQTGWDMEKSKLRPIVNAVEKGAIVIADFDKFKPEISAVGVPFELHGFWITGFNVLLPIFEYLEG